MNPRLPDSVHILRGTFQPCRHGEPDAKVVVEDELGDAPAYLNDRARAEWERIRKLFAGQGIYTAADRGPLATYCTYQAMQEADPEAFVESSSRVAQYRSLARELGLMPGVRDKLTRRKAESTDGFAPKPQRKVAAVREAG